jgi:hypothetical protein
MKFLIVLITVLSLAVADSNIHKVTLEKTEYHKGWDDGHCEGWKEVKGRDVYCPYPPYPPYPVHPKTTTSYKDGYTDGLIRGMKDAKK